MMPFGRSSLLEAKSLPPLIRLRRQLQAAAAPTAVKENPASVTREVPDGVVAASVEEKALSVPCDEGVVGDRNAQTKGGRVASGDRRSTVVALDESNVQPPLEVMVGLIVNQMVGKASLYTPADPTIYSFRRLVGR